MAPRRRQGEFTGSPSDSHVEKSSAQRLQEELEQEALEEGRMRDAVKLLKQTVVALNTLKLQVEAQKGEADRKQREKERDQEGAKAAGVTLTEYEQEKARKSGAAEIRETSEALIKQEKEKKQEKKQAKEEYGLGEAA